MCLLKLAWLNKPANPACLALQTQANTQSIRNYCSSTWTQVCPRSELLLCEAWHVRPRFWDISKTLGSESNNDSVVFETRHLTCHCKPSYMFDLKTSDPGFPNTWEVSGKKPSKKQIRGKRPHFFPTSPLLLRQEICVTWLSLGLMITQHFHSFSSQAPHYSVLFPCRLTVPGCFYQVSPRLHRPLELSGCCVWKAGACQARVLRV